MSINNNTKEYWDKDWGTGKRRFPSYTMNIVRWLIPEGLSVLDIGCGNGKFLRDVRDNSKPGKLFGIDISPVAIKKMNDSGIDGVVWDVENFNDFNMEFDVTVCTHVFEHVDNDIGLAKNIARVTKKLILVAVPNDCSYPEFTGTHVRKYNFESLCKLFENTDFKTIKNLTRTNKRMLKNHLIVSFEK